VIPNTNNIKENIIYSILLTGLIIDMVFNKNNKFLSINDNLLLFVGGILVINRVM
tara:strand:- start:409 stop:573 length:165 start_codon:yes stop_codon:yes gene_type:complete